MLKNIIFDWSGTLVDDLALTLDASNYVFRQYGKDELSTEEFREEFMLPYPNYYAKVLPDADLNQLENHFRDAFRLSQEPVSVLPHAREFMQWCKDKNIRCFILTSVDAKEFIIQCENLGMDAYFEAIHAGIRHKDKHIHQLLGQHGLNPEETAFIGDMQHDIETAHVGGITSIAVLTGYNNAKQLSKARPDLMVPDLCVLRTLLEKIAGTADSIPSFNSDEIHIQGLKLTCHIGVPDEERQHPQQLEADITLNLIHPLSKLDEQLESTVDYDKLARQITYEATARPRKLIETLAEDIASLCLKQPLVSQAKVKIRKFILPHTDHVAVSVNIRK